MKRIGFILLLFTSSVGFAQKYAVKTNLAYWATTTLNIGGEIALAPRMTLDMTANYNPFHFRGNKKIMNWSMCGNYMEICRWMIFLKDLILTDQKISGGILCQSVIS